MRLDVYLVEKGLAPTRTRAANLIKLGGVRVCGAVATKPACDVGEDEEVTATDVIGFASLGGLKLQKAFDEFGIKARGRAVDIGASNGGFTHCLLQNGAEHVYAVDVGACALPDFLLRDDRVTPMPEINARDLTPADLGGEVDFGTVDVSFISVTYVLPVLRSLLVRGGEAIVLVKPQFEVGKKGLTKTGVVKDVKTRTKALDAVCQAATAVGFAVAGVCEVPRLFEDKNVEYLLHLKVPV